MKKFTISLCKILACITLLLALNVGVQKHIESSINDNLDQYPITKLKVIDSRTDTIKNYGNSRNKYSRIITILTPNENYIMLYRDGGFPFKEQSVAYYFGGKINSICPEREFLHSECSEVVDYKYVADRSETIHNL